MQERLMGFANGSLRQAILYNWWRELYLGNPVYNYFGVCVQENQQLKQAGLKITLPRVKILQILEQATHHHLSAESIYKTLIEMGEDVGLATVYRVLTQFEAAGLVSKHNFEGGFSVFELTHADHHDHLVCIKCGRVEEFFDELIEQRQRLISQQAHFKMTDHSLNIYGLCQTCH